MKRAQLGSPQKGLELPKDLNHLPDTVAGLVPLYRACIVRFDAAVHARDFDAAAAAMDDARDLVERAQSFPRFAGRRTARGYRYCFYDVARVFDWLTRAVPGAVPLFGQQGDFVAFCSVTRVRFKTSGLAGDLGMMAFCARTWGFSIHAVEWERPFFSETGYRSFICSALEVGERTDDVRQWCIGHVRHWWNGDGGRPTKFALRRIRSAAPAAPAAPLPDSEEDDDAPTCPDCGDFTEGGGLCAGCRSNEGIRTSKQLTLF